MNNGNKLVGRKDRNGLVMAEYEIIVAVKFRR